MTALRWLAALAALELLALRWPRRRAYVGFDQHAPEPTPPDWRAVEPRWDCQHCRGTWAAEEVHGGYRCLHCGAVAPAEPQHHTLTPVGEPS